MRVILSLLLLAAAPLAASAQAAGGAPPAPAGLTISDAVWEPSYPTFSSHMLGEGPRGPAIHPTPRAGNTLSYGPSGAGDAGIRGPDAIWRHYSVKLTNTGTLSIRKVKFDFVFHDPATGEEVLRLGNSIGRRLRPGKTRVYHNSVESTRRTRRGDGARLSVEVTEVVYADGSVWRRP